MNGSMSLVEITATGLLAALVSAIVSKKMSDKESRLQYVTKERERWRHELRQFVAAVNEAFHSRVQRERRLKVLRAQIQVRLNPDDPLDNRILDTLNRMIQNRQEGSLSAFNEQMARLLKHDWERVKLEATGASSPRQIIWYTFAGAGVLLMALEARFNWSAKSYNWSSFVLWSAVLAGLWLLAVSGMPAWSRLRRLAFADDRTGRGGERSRRRQSVDQLGTAGRFLYILPLWWSQEVPRSIRTRCRSDGRE